MIRLKERRDKRLAHADAGILPNEFKGLLWGEVVDCVDALHSHYASLASALGLPFRLKRQTPATTQRIFDTC